MENQNRKKKAKKKKMEKIFLQKYKSKCFHLGSLDPVQSEFFFFFFTQLGNVIN